MLRPAVTLALLVLVGGCGGAKSQPTTPVEPPAEDQPVDPVLLRDLAAGIEEVLATMATITETAPDCPAMAAQLTQLFDQSTELFDLAKAQDADPEAGPILVAEMDKRAAAVQPLIDRVQRGLGRCQMDPDVRAAIDRMPTF